MRLLDRSGFCRRWPRLCSELDDSFRLFEDGERSEAKQAFHTEKVVGLLEEEMKDCLVGLAQYLFGKGMCVDNKGFTSDFFYFEKILISLNCKVILLVVLLQLYVS